MTACRPLMILRCLCTLVAVVIWSPAVPYAAAGRQPADLAAITVDVPAKGSIYPPDMAAPTFLWRDPTGTATGWRIEVSFEDRGPAIRKTVKGEPLRVGEIDQACVSPLVELDRPGVTASRVHVSGSLSSGIVEGAPAREVRRRQRRLRMWAA